MADGILPIPTIPLGLTDAAQRGVLIPFADIFARQRRIGWDAFGLEVDKFNPIAKTEIAA